MWRRRRRPFWLWDPFKWNISILSNNDFKKKKIELKIAKKRYEIDVLNIELKYWEDIEEKSKKIWFDID